MKFIKFIILVGMVLMGLFVIMVVFVQLIVIEEVEVIVKGLKKGLGLINKEVGIKIKIMIGQDFILN